MRVCGGVGGWMGGFVYWYRRVFSCQGALVCFVFAAAFSLIPLGLSMIWIILFAKLERSVTNAASWLWDMHTLGYICILTQRIHQLSRMVVNLDVCLSPVLLCGHSETDR